MTTVVVRTRPWGTRPDVTLLSSGHDVADARLHRVVGAALGRGLDVELLGLGSANDAPRGALVRTWERPKSLVRRLFHAVALPWRACGRVLVVVDPELVVPALLRARLTGRRLVVDVHEDYVKLVRDRAWAGRGLGAAVRAGVRVVVRLARRADLVVVADDHVPPLHVPRPGGGSRRLVVPNLPTADYLPDPAPRAATPRAVYVGDVRASRGLTTMLETVDAAPGWTLDLVGPVAPADRPAVAAWRETSPAADRVRWHGRRPPREAWHGAADAWVGLCLLDDTPAFRDALPSKVYEYLASGVPVLVTPRPRMAEMVRRSGAGVVVEDAREAAEVLRQWAADPATAQRHREAARRFALTLADGGLHYARLASRLAVLATD